MEHDSPFIGAGRKEQVVITTFGKTRSLPDLCHAPYEKTGEPIGGW